MNFVFFMPDEWRAESAGCYGHPVVRTPHLDRLAAEGTRFSQCHVQHTVCSPSRCSMMTGWYPHTSGHRTLWHLLRPHEPNLLRYLKEAGYDVQWYGKNDLLSQDSLRLSATEWDKPRRTVTGPSAGNAFPYPEPGYHSFLYEPYARAAADHPDALKVEQGIDFLRSKPSDPFFLYLPLSLPHPPYQAPQPWHDLIDPDSLPDLRPVVEDKPQFHRLIREYRRLGECPDSLLRKIQAVYLGSIAFMDSLLGQLLDTLDETGLAADTTVIVGSDHGDWAGDYGLVEKWSSALDDTLTRVPFVWRTPGGAAGHVVEEMTELFDLMPTVLELAGVECRHTHFARSLMPQLQGAAGDHSRAAFADGGYDLFEPRCFENPADFKRTPENIYYPKGQLQQDQPLSVCRANMVRTGSHKLIRRAHDRSEVYDVQADPRELVNLYGRREVAAVQAELEARLLEHLMATSDVTPWDRDPRGFQP